MIPFAAKAELKAAIVLGLAVAIFAAGWAVEGYRMGAQIADIKRINSEAQTKAAEKNAADLAAANLRGDRLVLQLAGWENTLVAFAQEKEREIKHLTTGHRCLSDAAVRVLNQPAGLQLQRSLPKAPGGPVNADAAFATDTDVGTWIAGAQRSYDTCRGRIAAIAEFYDLEEK